ncbi:MAG: small subunit ribosomal protein S8 [Parcubacteria group bacterium Gr01-1014_66]|nr:MAG: small subunit ribosomal protein S8 [Parcubacteria group bacterium Gr01-1014_66]
MHDPISDFFIRLKNAQHAGHTIVRIPYSRMSADLMRVLQSGGMIGAGEKRGKRARKILEVALHSKNSSKFVRGVRLISTPGRKLYVPSRALKSSRRGGMILLSTSRGVMDMEQARRMKIGGLLIAEVW